MPDTYAAPDLLADTAWLAEHLGDPGMVVVEMGTKAEDFEAGHIPGAIRCPSAQIKGTGDADPRLVAPPAEAKALFESIGVGDDALVVAYDRIRNRDASRLWWVLGYYGHANVKVLNGGWRGWIAEGKPVGLERSPGASGATFTPKRDESLLVKVDELKEACNLGDSVIWDVRSDGEWDGTASRGNKRVGHVPGAVHLEWFNVMDRTTQRFKSAEEIRQMLSGAGITPDKMVYAY